MVLPIWQDFGAHHLIVSNYCMEFINGTVKKQQCFITKYKSLPTTMTDIPSDGFIHSSTESFNVSASLKCLSMKWINSKRSLFTALISSMNLTTALLIDCCCFGLKLLQWRIAFRICTQWIIYFLLIVCAVFNLLRSGKNADLLGHSPWFPGDSSFRRQQ
jgi:hypothetical protein